jgi:hypothetical protein
MKKTVQKAYEAYFSSYASVTTMAPQQEINIYTVQAPMCAHISINSLNIWIALSLQGRTSPKIIIIILSVIFNVQKHFL